MTDDEFLELIGAKGGVIEALDYGLTADELKPGHLRGRWIELKVMWDRFMAEVDDFEDDYPLEDYTL